MLEDEENFVRLEAFQQMDKIFCDFTDEDLENSEVCKVMSDIYSPTLSEHTLREILDMQVQYLGKFMFKLGAKRLLSKKDDKGRSLAQRFTEYLQHVYERSKQETIKAVKAQDEIQMVDPDLQEDEETLVPTKRLRGEQAAAAEDKEFSEDETRKKLILNFPAITLTFLEADQEVAD